mmetsp:Transcript_132365/g.423580  ORF Transcript_132365/g.423580 Transcript_132365/m.423580 type:complete len:212 (+) Transcript_132365:553-1188(+)
MPKNISSSELQDPTACGAEGAELVGAPKPPLPAIGAPVTGSSRPMGIPGMPAADSDSGSLYVWAGAAGAAGGAGAASAASAAGAAGALGAFAAAAWMIPAKVPLDSRGSAAAADVGPAPPARKQTAKSPKMQPTPTNDLLLDIRGAAASTSSPEAPAPCSKASSVWLSSCTRAWSSACIGPAILPTRRRGGPAEPVGARACDCERRRRVLA